MNVIKEIERITEEEMKHGIFGGVTKGSWHDKYRDSAWVYIGGLSYELSEGDILCVMSQWGEIEDINLVRDKDNMKSMGFAFVKYEDQRSTILAVDNVNGTKLLGRSLRCDHVDKYKLPKDIREKEKEILESNPDAVVDIGPGHAYKDKKLENDFDINKGINQWQPASSDPVVKFEKPKKEKKEKKEKKLKKEKKSKDRSTNEIKEINRDQSDDRRDRDSGSRRDSRERRDGRDSRERRDGRNSKERRDGRDRGDQSRQGNGFILTRLFKYNQLTFRSLKAACQSSSPDWWSCCLLEG